MWPHSKQHSRMPVPCHLVPACNTCHESANLLPPSFLLFPGIRTLQALSLHVRIALSSLVHPWARQEEGFTPPFPFSSCANLAEVAFLGSGSSAPAQQVCDGAQSWRAGGSKASAVPPPSQPLEHALPRLKEEEEERRGRWRQPARRRQST